MTSQVEKITVEATINAPLQKVWDAWTKPEHIVGWAFASDDWEAPEAENDLRVGGKFRTRMAAKDKSKSFDFIGTYNAVEQGKRIDYTMANARKAETAFAELPEGVHIIQTFDPEKVNTAEVQRSGWQAILENFKKYVETHN